jgi:hypothetical protein
MPALRLSPARVTSNLVELEDLSSGMIVAADLIAAHDHLECILEASKPGGCCPWYPITSKQIPQSSKMMTETVSRHSARIADTSAFTTSDTTWSTTSKLRSGHFSYTQEWTLGTITVKIKLSGRDRDLHQPRYK